MSSLIPRRKFILPLGRLLQGRSLEEAAEIVGYKPSRLMEIKKQKQISSKTYLTLLLGAEKAKELEAEARARAERTEYRPLSYEERKELRALVAVKMRERYRREKQLGISR